MFNSAVWKKEQLQKITAAFEVQKADSATSSVLKNSILILKN